MDVHSLPAVNATLTQSTPPNTTFVSATPPGTWTCGTTPAAGGTGSIVCTATGAFNILSSSPGIGPFLAYQILTDLGYSEAFPFDESEFAMPGPGALDGIAKCFGKRAARSGKAIIRYMAETQDEHFARLGLEFPGLRGRPLQLIDIQNLFCEISKYARVVHPDIPGISKRSRIKQRYQQPDPSPLTAWFPPKWGLGDSYSNIPGNTS